MSSTTPGSEPDDEVRRDEGSEPEAAVDPSPAEEASVEREGAPEPEPVSDPTEVEFIEPADAESSPSAGVAADADDADEYDAPISHSDAAPAGADAATPAAFDEPEPSDAAETSALDAAVLRANAGAEPSAVSDDERNGIDDADSVPQPVPAGAVRRETYVPASTAAVAGAAGAATLAPEPAVEPASPFGAQTVYVQAPEAPRAKGNRAFGVLVALIGTALFAALYAGIAYLLLLGQGAADEVNSVFVERFLAAPVYWVPIVAFFVGFALLAAIVNRGRWWAYVVFGLLVGVLVYFSYLGGALLTVEAWTLTFEEAQSFIAQRWLDPFAIVAALIAREIPIWLGGWIAARGRTVTERNRVALEAYDRELAAGPQLQR